MRVLRSLVLIGSAFVAGAVSAVALPYLFTANQILELGPWTTAKSIGTEDTNPYVRAWVARHGIWALPREEVLYFGAETDSAGETLSTTCSYALEGPALPARWWSVTTYRDEFWMDNPLDRYSLTSVVLEPGEDGQWRAMLGPEGEGVGAAWLPTDGRPGKLTLTLRLYDPDPAVVRDTAALVLPTIKRGACA